MWTVIKRKPIWNSKVFREVGICCQEARPCCIVPWLFLVNRWTALSVLWPKCTLGFHDRGGNWGVPVFQGSRPGNEVSNLRWKFRVKKTKKQEQQQNTTTTTTTTATTTTFLHWLSSPLTHCRVFSYKRGNKGYLAEPEIALRCVRPTTNTYSCVHRARTIPVCPSRVFTHL